MMFSQQIFFSTDLPRPEGIEKTSHVMVFITPGYILPALVLAQALLQQNQALSTLGCFIVLWPELNEVASAPHDNRQVYAA